MPYILKSSKPFTRKLKMVRWNWQVFWLGRLLIPSRTQGVQWLQSQQGEQRRLLPFQRVSGLTATGIAPDSHRFPFSSA